MLVRYAKIALLAAVALHLALVVFNNVTDYGTNFVFVKHVLSMDDVFPGTTLRWRALEHPVWHHAFYILIILWETMAMVLCSWGTLRLWCRRAATASEFDAAKQLAVAGLTLGLLLWLVAFLDVGGEWFAMWQSRTWNGQSAAFRLFGVMGLVLVFLNQREASAAAT